MHGLPAKLSGRYGTEIQIMRYMGWSWQDLMAAPADMIEEVAFRMYQEDKWQTEQRKLEAEMRG